MRKLICIGNLAGAALLTLLALASLSDVVFASEKVTRNSLLRTGALSADSILWVWSGVVLLRRQSLLAWSGSLAANGLLVFSAGMEFMRMQTLMWRAERGDPEVPLDPVVGMPWLFSGIVLFVSVALLAAVGVVPALRRRPPRIAEPDGPANGSQPIRSETNQTSSTAGSRR